MSDIEELREILDKAGAWVRYDYKDHVVKGQRQQRWCHRQFDLTLILETESGKLIRCEQRWAKRGGILKDNIESVKGVNRWVNKHSLPYPEKEYLWLNLSSIVCRLMLILR